MGQPCAFRSLFSRHVRQGKITITSLFRSVCELTAVQRVSWFAKAVWEITELPSTRIVWLRCRNKVPHLDHSQSTLSFRGNGELFASRFQTAPFASLLME